MGFLGVSWIMWGVVALIIAGVFVVFVPYRRLLTNAVGLRRFILNGLFRTRSCQPLTANGQQLIAKGEQHP